MLDAQRSFVNDSFDFIIQSIGIYENKDLVLKACRILENKFNEMIQNLDSDLVPILRSETTMENCYDIVLENEDYTMGKSLEYVLYEEYYQQDKLSFCGFKKFHPHDDNSKIRSSTGVALDWFTPIGPLSLSYAIPLTKNNSDVTESIRFNIGTTF